MNMNERRVIAWRYDLFPYALLGVVEQLEVQNDLSITGYVESYRSKFKVFHHLPLDAGLSIKSELEQLAMEQQKEEAELRARYKKRALTIAPFLSALPAYKKEPQ